MASDVVTYALLASIFVVMGLRMYFEKPNKLHEIPLLRWKRAASTQSRRRSS
jgi:hypothetical protein